MALSRRISQSKNTFTKSSGTAFSLLFIFFLLFNLQNKRGKKPFADLILPGSTFDIADTQCQDNSSIGNERTLALIHAIVPPYSTRSLLHPCSCSGKRGRGHTKTPEQLHTASTVLYVKRCSCSICSLVFSCTFCCVTVCLPCDCGGDNNRPGCDTPQSGRAGTLLLFGTFNSDSGFSCGAFAPLFSHFFLF